MDPQLRAMMNGAERFEVAGRLDELTERFIVEVHSVGPVELIEIDTALPRVLNLRVVIFNLSASVTAFDHALIQAHRLHPLLSLIELLASRTVRWDVLDQADRQFLIVADD
jgi:hypothetical protein